MSDIYTQTLARAAQAQRSTQALASLLHVPESTLLRWMSGRAQMPVPQHEKKGGDYPATSAAGADKLTFRMGRLRARCDGSEFAYSLCGERVVHGNLIARAKRRAALAQT